MTLSDERDARREANAAIAHSIGEKLLKTGARLTKDERTTAGLILKSIAELIADKPGDEYDTNYFWTLFDIRFDVQLNFLLGAGEGRTEEPGGAL